MLTLYREVKASQLFTSEGGSKLCFEMILERLGVLHFKIIIGKQQAKLDQQSTFSAGM